MSKYFPETAVSANELGKLVEAGAVEAWQKDANGELWFREVEATDEKLIRGVPSKAHHGVFQADDDIQATDEIGAEFPDDSEYDSNGNKIYDAEKILEAARTASPFEHVRRQRMGLVR